MKVYPAILEKNISSFTKSLKKVSQLSSCIQIDIADNILVSGCTLPLYQAVKEIKHYRQHVFTIDLMVTDIQSNLDQLKNVSNIQDVFIRLSPFKKQNIVTKKYSFPINFAIHPDERIFDIWHDIKNCSCIEIMTIHPGKQGNPFLPAMLEKIKQLKEHGFKGTIALDGGINSVSIYDILHQTYLPDILYSGSFIKSAPQENYKKLCSIIESFQKQQS